MVRINTMNIDKFAEAIAFIGEGSLHKVRMSEATRMC